MLSNMLHAQEVMNDTFIHVCGMQMSVVLNMGCTGRIRVMRIWGIRKTYILITRVTSGAILGFKLRGCKIAMVPV